MRSAQTIHGFLIRERIQECASVQEQLLSPPFPQIIEEIAHELVACFRSGGKVILFGNGGSAADAMHVGAELLGRFRRDRAPLPAVTLDSLSAITAIANDYAYDEVFSRQIDGLGVPGDVAIGMSTSGRSANVLRAITTARQRGMMTVGLTGADGVDLAEAADLCLRVPADDTARIQECSMLVAHIVCEIVEQEMFPQ